jgi:hypothetical protein
VIPELPPARYQIWVRGYGLVDSAKVESEPGKQPCVGVAYPKVYKIQMRPDPLSH